MWFVTNFAQPYAQLFAHFAESSYQPTYTQDDSFGFIILHQHLSPPNWRCSDEIATAYVPVVLLHTALPLTMYFGNTAHHSPAVDTLQLDSSL